MNKLQKKNNTINTILKDTQKHSISKIIIIGHTSFRITRRTGTIVLHGSGTVLIASMSIHRRIIRRVSIIIRTLRNSLIILLRISIRSQRRLIIVRSKTLILKRIEIVLIGTEHIRGIHHLRVAVGSRRGTSHRRGLHRLVLFRSRSHIVITMSRILSIRIIIEEMITSLSFPGLESTMNLHRVIVVEIPILREGACTHRITIRPRARGITKNGGVQALTGITVRSGQRRERAEVFLSKEGRGNLHVWCRKSAGYTRHLGLGLSFGLGSISLHLVLIGNSLVLLDSKNFFITLMANGASLLPGGVRLQKGINGDQSIDIRGGIMSLEEIKRAVVPITLVLMSIQRLTSKNIEERGERDGLHINVVEREEVVVKVNRIVDIRKGWIVGKSLLDVLKVFVSVEVDKGGDVVNNDLIESIDG